MDEVGENHVPDAMTDLLHHLQGSAFRDIAGARVSAVIPVSEALVNRLIAATLPATAPVRDVVIQPEPNDRFSVRITPKAALLPSITLKLAIEEQPRLPESAVLVLRMATLSGIFGLASGMIAGMLPPAVRLQGETIRVDLRALAAERGQAELLDHLRSLEVHTDQGRVILHVDAGVG